MVARFGPPAEAPAGSERLPIIADVAAQLRATSAIQWTPDMQPERFRRMLEEKRRRLVASAPVRGGRRRGDPAPRAA